MFTDIQIPSQPEVPVIEVILWVFGIGFSDYSNLSYMKFRTKTFCEQAVVNMKINVTALILL